MKDFLSNMSTTFENKQVGAGARNLNIAIVGAGGYAGFDIFEAPK